MPEPSWLTSAPGRALLDALTTGGVVVLSGAGLSTASGLPDYRGPNGERRVEPMTIAQFRANHLARQRYWARSYVGWSRFAAAAPNAGHAAVAAWERLGVVDAVITQNVDGLHQQAGSRRVVELHGSLAEVVCLHCRTIFARADLQSWMTALNPQAAAVLQSASQAPLRPDGDVDVDPAWFERWQVPPCPTCGSDLLKAHVVMFGESVDRPVVDRCFELVDQARALVVLGSSLGVMSGLRFARRAAAHGIPLILANRGWSRAAELTPFKIDEDLTRALPQATVALESALRAAAAPR
ncbi:NAD-dependent protein deacetylase 1 [Calidifontibacter sp. DB0510]|uniref:protein acetyllysine N-acetyltransferase n=1 Tax=Metallococcus carri TaxID=1656884 RepID=A0A967B0J2_9MICO|nr:Sir2 family NAD-dependent protein deacetylase [Metallococcus carri]NHN56078.1 NAD-dependent protein deacetylase 1 [Metallococcus carri]NOP37465.1 NAD-dependent protein deacetylase 1 [Calidifontibacter sp. DB2511S]